MRSALHQGLPARAPLRTCRFSLRPVNLAFQPSIRGKIIPARAQSAASLSAARPRRAARSSSTRRLRSVRLRKARKRPWILSPRTQSLPELRVWASSSSSFLPPLHGSVLMAHGDARGAFAAANARVTTAAARAAAAPAMTIALTMKRRRRQNRPPCHRSRVGPSG